MATLKWLTKEIFNELLLVARPEVTLVPSFLENYFRENGLAAHKGIEFHSKVKNIKFLTHYVRNGGDVNGELDDLVKKYKIPVFAFQLVDMAPDDIVAEVKEYLFESWRADQGASKNEFLRAFREVEKEDQDSGDSDGAPPQDAGQEWREMGGREAEFARDVDKLFDGKGNMKPVTMEITTKSGKKIQMTMRVVNGEMAAKMWDELEKKYGKEWMKEHVKILSGQELKDFLENELGEEIESMEIAGGELTPGQFGKAGKMDPERLNKKMQQMANQFKKQEANQEGEQEPQSSKKSDFSKDDPELLRLIENLENFD